MNRLPIGSSPHLIDCIIRFIGRPVNRILRLSFHQQDITVTDNREIGGIEEPRFLSCFILPSPFSRITVIYLSSREHYFLSNLNHFRLLSFLIDLCFFHYIIVIRGNIPILPQITFSIRIIKPFRSLHRTAWITYRLVTAQNTILHSYGTGQIYCTYFVAIHTYLPNTLSAFIDILWMIDKDLRIIRIQLMPCGSNHLVGIFQSIRIACLVFQRFTRHFQEHSRQNSLHTRFANPLVITKRVNIKYQFFRLLHILYNLLVNIRQRRFRQIVIIGRHCRSKFQGHFTKERGQQIIEISSQEKSLSFRRFHHIRLQFFTFDAV